MDKKISACLVVHNEEKNISRCLESLKSTVDEMVVVHDGKCEDKTLDICRQYTDRIYKREYVGEAEPHRAFSFQQASGDWILQIDADEFLSSELKGKIRELVKNETVNAYEFLWPLWSGSEQITKNWPYKRCLFRKNKSFFLGIPHFVVRVSGQAKKSRFVLEHRPEGNNFTFLGFKNKAVKRAKIQARVYLKNFKEVSKFNYQENGWPLKIKLRVRFPLLLMPVEFFIVFGKVLVSGAAHEGIIGYKIALWHSVYRAMVNYYIFKFKKEMRKNLFFSR